MWQSITKQISECMDAPFTIEKHQLLLHTPDSSYYRITDQKHVISFVVRITPKSLAAKFDILTRNLALMADWLVSPKIILYGTTSDQCFVVFLAFCM